MKKAESIINLLKKILIIVGKHKKKPKGQKENSYVFLNRPTQNYYMCLGVYFNTLNVLYRNFTTICHHNLLCSYFDDKYICSFVIL